jgi:regulator of sigma E protease
LYNFDLLDMNTFDQHNFKYTTDKLNTKLQNITTMNEIFNKITNLSNISNLASGLFFGILIFIAIFIPAVIIHEFGHLFMSRLVGVKIPEYGIGMPFTKRWFYFKKFGIIWSFYPLLLGGFVRIYGDNDAIDNAYFDSKNAEGNKEKALLVKSNFRQSKLEEIIVNRDLEFFLKDQNLEYDQTWKRFETIYNKKTITEEEQDFKNSKEKTLFTLIDWEYDKEITGHKKDTFFSKNWLQQTLIILGGVSFNIITAIICYTILFTSFYVPKGQNGKPMNIDFINQIGNNVNFSYKSDYIKFPVVNGGLAKANGITAETKIFEIGGKKSSEIKSFDDVRQIIKQNRGKLLNLKVEENNQIVDKNIQLDNQLGIAGAFVDAKFTSNSKNIIDDLKVGVFTVYDFVGKNFNEFGKIGTAIVQKLTGQMADEKAFDNISSPVKSSNLILEIFQENKDIWPELYLTFLAAISIALAVFNILPIPALDGGRWLILTITKITGRRNRRFENTLISLTFLALMGLGLFMIGKETIELTSKTFK